MGRRRKIQEIVLLHRRPLKANKTTLKNEVCFAFWKSIPAPALPPPSVPALYRNMGRFSDEKRGHLQTDSFCSPGRTFCFTQDRCDLCLGYLDPELSCTRPILDEHWHGFFWLKFHRVFKMSQELSILQPAVSAETGWWSGPTRVLLL